MSSRERSPTPTTARSPTDSSPVRPRSRTSVTIRCYRSSSRRTAPRATSCGARIAPTKRRFRGRCGPGSAGTELVSRVVRNGSTDLLEDADRLLPDLVEIRRRIHRTPELGLFLPKTQASVLDAIDGLGLDVRTGESVSSVVADLEGGDGPVVLLRGDMDALPMPEDTGLEFSSDVYGCMHACGHDAHTAMLIGVARLLHARRADLRGTVRFMFQPGEEGHHGARY